MERKRTVGIAGLALCGMIQAGCASEDLEPIEPELLTPGAFVAVRDYDKGHEFSLIRTIDRYDFQVDILIFYSTYDVDPTSWEDARELSKQHDLPLRKLIEAQPTAAITTKEWRVVWFRTLTDAEKDRAK